MEHGRFCTVAVALPLHETYTYQVPESLDQTLRPGHRVLVPFGRRRVTGYVLDRCDECALDMVKPVIDLLDPEPALDEARLRLCKFAADYYQQPLGEVIKTALPAGINQASKIHWTLTEAGILAEKQPGIAVTERRLLICMDPGKSYNTAQLSALCDAATGSVLDRLAGKGWIDKEDQLEQATTRAKFVDLFFPAEGVDSESTLNELSRAPKQREVFDFVVRACRADAPMINAAIPGARPALNALVKKELLATTREESYRDTGGGFESCEIDPVTLNEMQEAAYNRVSAAIEAESFAPFLLHGITGSGKTEVYIRLARAALERGKTVLVLVPEIALTPQLLSRFSRRFGSRVAISHSGLSDPERYDQWRRMQRGEADLCVGTRSAIFSPLDNLGLLVVDEENDSSYKQDESFCYNARDLALVLGKQLGAAVLLGSATPSLESYHAAKNGRYELIELPERATRGTLPEVAIVDLTEQIALKGKGKPREKDETGRALPTASLSLTPPLEKALKETVAQGEQAILFLNRRGFFTHAFCLECRRPVMCPNCEVSLTVHGKRDELRCHYCGHSQLANVVCDHCGGMNFFSAGLGTQQVEAAVAELLPEAKVARLDRDTTSRKGSLEKILSEFAAGRHDVLVGTQMVAKGHDFPNVTLVGVLSADTSTNLPDFRAAERTFALLSQVAGRAGRGDKPGKVIVQTFNPEHYAIMTARTHDFPAFYEREIAGRGNPEHLYPPFTRLGLVRARSRNDDSARSFLLMLANSLRQHVRDQGMQDVKLLGPTKSALSKIKTFYRYQLLIKAPSPSILVALVRDARAMAENWKHPGVEWHVDIDPQSLL
jgi:primosomal protein N' (replication factor Y) (superfamily II helicase)